MSTCTRHRAYCSSCRHDRHTTDPHLMVRLTQQINRLTEGVTVCAVSSIRMVSCALDRTSATDCNSQSTTDPHLLVRLTSPVPCRFCSSAVTTSSVDSFSKLHTRAQNASSSVCCHAHSSLQVKVPIDNTCRCHSTCHAGSVSRAYVQLHRLSSSSITHTIHVCQVRPATARSLPESGC